MKKLMLFSMWLAGSAAAVGVAWAGVSVVDNQAVAPPSASDFGSLTPVDESLSGDAATPSSEPTSATAAEPGASPTPNRIEDTAAPVTPIAAATAKPSLTLPTPSATPASAAKPKSQTPEPKAAPTTAPTATPGTTGAGPTAVPAATPVTTATAVPTVTAEPTAAATTAASSTETFALTGGTTAISFSPSGVEVLWATPNPGFSVKIEPESPGIKVEFRADHHRSRVDAWWSGGPQHSIREEPRD